MLEWYRQFEFRNKLIPKSKIDNITISNFEKPDNIHLAINKNNEALKIVTNAMRTTEHRLESLKKKKRIKYEILKQHETNIQHLNQAIVSIIQYENLLLDIKNNY